MTREAVQLAAQLLGTGRLLAQDYWSEALVQSLEEATSAARGNEVAELRERDRRLVIEELREEDPDPLRAATGIIARVAAPDREPSASNIEMLRMSRSVLPTEVVNQFNRTTTRANVAQRWATLPKPACDLSVGDPHVHSGGVSPPIVLLRSLVQRLTEVPAAGLELELSDAEGSRFAAEPLILALGASAVALTLPRNIQASFRDFASVLNLSAQDLWSTAFDLAFSRPMDHAITTVRAGYQDLIWRVGAPQMTAAVLGVDDWLRYRLKDDAAYLARGCLAAFALLHSSLVSPAHGGLDVFDERFDLARKLRYIQSTDDHIEVDRVENSLRFLLAGGRLSRVELRKSVDHGTAGARPDMYRSILDDVAVHATAVSRVLETGVDLAVQMPVSFVRHRPAPFQGGLGEVPLRYPLMNALSLANGIARAWVHSSDMRDFIGSVDVVGRESDAPNWVYAIAYKYLDDAVRSFGITPPGYSVHAGEQFGSSLEGLRLAGEVALFGVEVRRVGHALSLSPFAAATAAEGQTLTAAAVLESLIWATLTEPTLRGLADETCGVLGSLVFAPLVPTSDELRDWFRARFDFARLQRIGVVPAPDDFRAEVIPTDEAITVASLTLQGRVDRMLAASLAMAPVADTFFDPGRRVPPALKPEVGRLMDECYKGCLPRVLDDFRKNRTVEACPSSNVAIGKLAGIMDHPVGSFKDQKLRVTVSSDDPGLFGALVEDEILSVFHAGALPFANRAGTLREIVMDSLGSAAGGVSPDRTRQVAESLRI